MLENAAKARSEIAAVPLPPAAFLFVDIVGFTSFTEEHGDREAAELAWRLRLGVERQLGDDAHVVKTLGDAVMVRMADPGQAVEAAVRILELALPEQEDPDVRIGVHCGPAIECEGDFFGAAVNTAARVAALAAPGEILVTGEVAAAARKREVSLSALGERTLRNVARPVELHRVQPSPRGSDRFAVISTGVPARRRRPLMRRGPIHAGA